MNVFELYAVPAMAVIDKKTHDYFTCLTGVNPFGRFGVTLIGGFKVQGPDSLSSRCQGPEWFLPELHVE